ncbi:MAG: ubiquinone biosynthesis protein COQ7 [Dehalococcoidia bacterium]|nr:MAG: ubiquinone biosynthesis protein COQ7 [Dehalococcoidia bacterium]
MDFSNPFGTMVPRKMTGAELTRAIMQDIAAELDAIALYQAHIDATDDERAKKVLAHARDDEKEHVGEFLALLEILDPQQAEYIKKGKVEIAELLVGK